MSHLNSQMSDFDSRKPELSGLKSHRNCSFFCMPSLFEGMSNNKGSSDYESAWSPTSPLDFRVFSNLGNPFGGSSKSNKKGYQKSWDSGKVGLSIVDSLDDHTDSSSRIVLQPPDSKNILFGFTKCQKIHHLPNPISQDHKTNVVSESGLHLQSSFNHLKKSQESSLCGHLENDYEISEDYTCVILHGPNPRTTRIYGDQVLDSLEHNASLKDCTNKKESIFEIAPFTLTTPSEALPDNDFLSFCYYCSKKLNKEKDIYMYRGYKGFCSTECRLEEIHLDEEMEAEEEEEEASSGKSSGSFSDKDMKEKKSHGVVFTVG